MDGIVAPLVDRTPLPCGGLPFRLGVWVSGEGDGQMTICSGHDQEVCYESRNCPACTIEEDLKDTIKDLGNRIGELETEVSDLKLEASEKE